MAPSHDPQLLKGVLSLLLLHLLAEHESYGYEVVQRLQQAGFTDVLEGSVYPALTRLQRDGRVATRLVPSPSGPARKYYRLTPAGWQALRPAPPAWATAHRRRRRRPVPAAARQSTASVRREADMPRPSAGETGCASNAWSGCSTSSCTTCPGVRASPPAARSAPTCWTPPATSAPARHCAGSAAAGSSPSSTWPPSSATDRATPGSPRPTSAALTPLLLNYVFAEAADAFRTGVTAARARTPPAPSPGTASATCESAITLHLHRRPGHRSGGGWTPLTYALWIHRTIAAGRLWRLLPSRARQTV